MATALRNPWKPDRSWADPLIATLALLIALLVGLSVMGGARQGPARQTRVSLEGRAQEVLAAFQQRLGVTTPVPRTQATPKGAWDRALAAVLLAEAGRLPEAKALALEGPEPSGKAGSTFRPLWRWAYLQEGTAPSTPERLAVRQALGDGPAALRLEARLETREGRDGTSLVTQAQALEGRWLIKAVVLGLGVLGLVGLGLAVIIYQVATLDRRPAHPLPVVGMSGRALILVLEAWFLASMLSGVLAGGLAATFPSLRALALPIQYVLHASAGLGMLAWAEGLTLRDFLRRLSPGPLVPALVWGLLYYAVAVTSVLLVGAAISPFLPKDAAPQRELMEFLGSTRGPLLVGLLFLTVAGLAPFFEEVLFRGALLPWLHQRFTRAKPTHLRALAAVLVSGLLFGAIHLQPLGMPTLATLGIVLGFAMLRTHNLWTAVVLHSLWNGATFLLVRAL